MSAYESGQTLGRYRIVRPLGMGAMGRVYLAEDPRIERLLAVKTVRVEGGHTEVEDRKRRLLREAKAAGKLSHHHVVTLYDAGEDGDTLFLVFEYVKGSDLAARLAAGPPLSLGEALRAVRQAAEGLDYAHQQGIVHRDIKPSNLMLDERGWVKVSDFGIAKLAGQSTELTMTGSVVGSPHYLSPEQIRGEELDGRSDIFSLGVVLYELLGGRRPFEGETLTSLIYQILNTEPPPPLGPGEPLGRLNALVRRMMAKEREERYQSAAEVVAEIGAVERELTGGALASPAAQALPPPPAAPTRATEAPAAPPAAEIVAGAARGRGGRTALVVGAAAAGLLVVLAAGGFLAWRMLNVGGGGTEPAGGAQQAEAGATDGQAADPAGRGGIAGAGAVPPAGEDARAGGRTPPSSPAAEVATREPGEAAGRLGREGDRPAPLRPTGAAQTTAGISSAAESAGPRRSEAGAASGPSAGTAARTPPLPVPGPSAADRSLERVASGAPEGAPEDPPEAEEEAPARASWRYDREVSSGMTLRLAAEPADAFVLVDGRLVGKANELSAQGGYTLPDPGDHLVVVRKEGRRDARLLVKASPGGGGAPLAVRLPFVDAATSELGDLQLVRAQEGVGFKVEPKGARVLVDGVDRGAASTYGGLGRGWLKLPPGRHRVSLVAPGHQRVDLAVEVSSGAAEKHETIRLRLPPAGG